MAKTKYPTLEERGKVTVTIERFTKTEIKQANSEFKRGMADYFKESDQKIAKSAKKASNYICK